MSRYFLIIIFYTFSTVDDESRGLCYTTFVREVLTVQCMVLSCACFGLRHSPYFNYFNVAHLTKQQYEPFLTSLVMMRAEIRTDHLPDNERMRYVLRHCRRLFQYCYTKCLSPPSIFFTKKIQNKRWIFRMYGALLTLLDPETNTT